MTFYSQYFHCASSFNFRSASWKTRVEFFPDVSIWVFEVDI
jgi:hypothetical protein